jgi:hypothetical protein
MGTKNIDYDCNNRAMNEKSMTKIDMNYALALLVNDSSNRCQWRMKQPITTGLEDRHRFGSRLSPWHEKVHRGVPGRTPDKARRSGPSVSYLYPLEASIAASMLLNFCETIFQAPSDTIYTRVSSVFIFRFACEVYG